MVMSRSVIMPARRSLSQMSSVPTSRAFIFCAASCSVICGDTHSAWGVMISLTFMMRVLSRRRRLADFNFVGNDRQTNLVHDGVLRELLGVKRIGAAAQDDPAI